MSNCRARLILPVIVFQAFLFVSLSTAHAGPQWMTTVCERLFTVERPGSHILPEGTPEPVWPDPVDAAPGQRKVVILSSGFGMGHNSTARAIESAIQGRDANALIRTIEIEDLQHPYVTRLEKFVFWTMVKKVPWLFDVFYRRHMEATAKRGLPAVRQNVDQAMLEDFIAREKPDVIVAVHQMTAAALAMMRQKGLLAKTRVAFIATDYFVDFLPEVSRNIDYTLVPHPELVKQWVEHGVPAEKVDSTGMPVNPEAFKPVDRTEFLTTRKLDPKVTTITLASGGEGVGNYPKIVRSLAASYAGPGRRLQIVAVCGNNKAHFKKLSAMKEELRAKGVELVVLGFTKQPEMFGYIKSSDLYITKSGGLSPSEGFAMNKPMILLDVYGGHERVNAKFFESIDVAVINRDQSAIGAQVRELLANSEAQDKMLKAQREVTKLQDFSKISKFAVP